MVPPEKADGAKATSPGGDDLAAWMTQYGPALRAYFSRRADPAEADDLVQDVFVKLQAREGSPLENVEGYLFKVAKHVLVSRFRHDSADGLWRHDTLDESIHARDELSPERALAAKQELDRALVTILNLPPRTRAAFEFHRFDKLSYSAIAKRMGITKASVQDLMQRAIDRLTEELGQHDGGRRK